METGKWYFETGDIISVQIAEDEKEAVFFKNPIEVRGCVSAGGFFLKISTPFVNADIEEITNKLRQAMAATLKANNLERE